MSTSRRVGNRDGVDHRVKVEFLDFCLLFDIYVWILNLSFVYNCLTPNSRCNFRARVSLNVHSFILEDPSYAVLYIYFILS